jgi:hypothetical protein
LLFVVVICGFIFLSLVLPELCRALEASRFRRYTFSWVAHMREEARQTAAREADRPAIGHKTGQAENPDVLLGRT